MRGADFPAFRAVISLMVAPRNPLSIVSRQSVRASKRSRSLSTHSGTFPS